MRNLLFLSIFFSSFIQAQDSFIEGTDYQLIDDQPSSYVSKKSNHIKVVEAFWYGCPHCYVIEEYLSKWDVHDDKLVKFINMPVVFNKKWLLHARAFYTMKELENFEVLHKKFFYAYHEQQRTFSNKESIINFIVSHGELKDLELKDRVEKIFLSDEVSKKVQEANYLLETYQIDSVPAMIINDKYKISGRMAKTYERMLEISEFIINLEKKKRSE